MNDNHLNPFSATGVRVKQIDDAKEMQKVIAERANRTGDRVPPYEFLELIGKGAFGRVYKWYFTTSGSRTPGFDPPACPQLTAKQQEQGDAQHCRCQDH